MKQLSLSLQFRLFCALILFIPGISYAQLLGDNAFLQGAYVEAGIASNGSMGSQRLTPAGYHPRSPSVLAYDPGLGTSSTSTQRLMMVYDAGHDGWSVGIPAGIGYFGDYSMPGTPYEGWSVAINGVRGDAVFQTFNTTAAVTGYTNTLPMTGTVTGYSSAPGTCSGTWQGTAGTGSPLTIKQVFKLDTTASWVRLTVTLKNVSASTLTGIYYMRHLDPDNDQISSGSFSTTNVINYQNDYYHRVMVTATGTFYTTQTLSMLTKDCRAKCFIGTTWPSNNTGQSLANYYAGTATGTVYTGSNTGDYAMGIVWNLGNLAAGDSTVLTMAYVYNGLLGLDSAVGFPQMVVNGVARDSIDTVTACAFSGDTLWANITNATTADWAGSTWTWAPSSYLLSTTGVTNGILASTMTVPVTYTITGTPAFGGCGNKVFRLTVMPPGVTPTPAVHDTSLCQGGATGPMGALASGIGTIMWFTTPTGGTGTSTPPTPPTGTATTFTYYVSQVVAGCSSARVPVNIYIVPPSAPITGTMQVCQNFNTTLSDITPGGTWVSSNTAVGTVGLLTGIVYGASAGTTTIDYMQGTGCYVNAIVTVNPTPPAITGTVNVCVATTATLSNTMTGGTWSASNSNVTISNPSVGYITGANAGTTTITYTSASGCYITMTMNVIGLPNPISGPNTLCIGSCTTYTSTSPAGIWSSGLPASGTPATSIASIVPGSGYTCGVAVGTATISYRLNGCSTTKIVSVVATPPAITGVSTVCPTSTTTLFNTTTGGTWSIGLPSSGTPSSIASITSGGVVTGIAFGTATVTYALGSSCQATQVISVQPAATPIIGTLGLCTGGTTTLTNSTSGGTWSSLSTSVAPVDPFGVVTGLGGGGGTATIVYTMPTGCPATAIVTVNTPPTALLGSYNICQGGITTLGSAPTGGTWSSGAPSVATVGTGGDVVSAGPAGTATIVYTLTFPAGQCSASAVVTVNPNPNPIGGLASAICAGQTVPLTGTPSGGTWTSSATGTASVDLSTGVLTGGTTAGTANITYTLGSAGCYTVGVATVNPTPTIAGSTGVCLLATTTLTGTPAGGTWSSSSAAVSMVTGSFGAAITGVTSGGTSNITYTVGGCNAVVTVTVNTPPAISGVLAVCAGNNTTLSSTIPGGTWSMPCSFATVGATSGIVTAGATAGTCTVTYTTGAGCAGVGIVTVNALPTPITGGPSVCGGATITMGSTPSGGTWASSTPSVATINSAGVLTASSSATGTTTITYTTASTFCTATKVVSVVSAPAATTGTFTVCLGSTATLSNTVSGGTWSTSCGNVSIGGTSGVYTGLTAGTCVITYSIGSGCAVYTTVTVLPLPLPISGSTALCVGSTATLTSSTGVNWTSSNTTAAPIVAGTGLVTGAAAGTSTITAAFNTTGCSVSTVVTVNPIPSAPTGVLNTCIGSCTTLSHSLTGTWSASCPAILTVNSTTGSVCGVSAGTCAVTFTASTGCKIAAPVTVNPLPSTIGGPSSVCVGSTITVTNTTAGGSWTIGTPSSSGTPTTIATVSGSGSTGYVTGVAPGTVTLTYTVGSGCYIATTITVNAAPNPITGPVVTCIGSCAALGGTPAGGVWSISPTIIATVSPTGNVCGVNAGTAIVSYINGAGCMALQTMTVNSLPGAITGSGVACTGATTTYSSSPTGGIWSISPTTVATVNPTTGEVYGVVGATAGSTATLSYTVGTGCTSTTIVTLQASPASISGSLGICIYACTTLSSSPSGGTWLSGGATATINPSTGYVCGNAAGTTNITYMLSSGCTSVRVLTVNPLPTAIGGTLAVCQGLTAAMTGTPAGGTWAITPTTVATVNPTTGVWYGVITGATAPATATVTYTSAAGCSITSVVTVNPLPTAITGTFSIPLGYNVTLASTPTGGTWSSGSPAFATIVPPVTSGTVFGTALGTSNITYTLPSTGCYAVQNVTVNPTPPGIPDTFVCLGLTRHFTNSMTGGVWSSSNVFVATINSAGDATGLNPGTTTICYTIPSTGTQSCATLTVYALPAAISGTPTVCQGFTTTLSTTSTGGSWSSSATATATVNSAGVVTGVAGGVVTISYTLPTSCYVTYQVTVNTPPSAIAGSSAVCNIDSTHLTGVPAGGTWSVSPLTGAATINSTTGWLFGSALGSVVVTYTLPTGCYRTTVDSVIAAPYPITGPDQVCEGAAITISNVIGGGTWSSSNGAIATVTPVAALDASVYGVFGGSSGMPVTITYQISTGCAKSHNVTVNALPGAISGVPVMCEGNTTTLYNGTPGGNWSSLNPASAPIDPLTGVVTGSHADTATIVYTTASGCTTTIVVTVQGLPTAIAGNLSLCVGQPSTLSSTPAGGNWWSSNSLAATVNFVSGVAFGVSPGTTTITYVLPTGCMVTAVATVNNVPSAITGPNRVCEGDNITLVNSTTGGFWISANPALATADPLTGVVTGVAAGNVFIIYQMPTGCSASKLITVNVTPAAISGPLTVCAGYATNLSSSPTGGVWSTNLGTTSTIGTINPTTGVLTGISGGTVVVSYTMPTTCYTASVATVNNLPPSIGGVARVCVNSVTTLTNAVGAGTWSTANPAIATVDPIIGAATGVAQGLVTISFTDATTGCSNVRELTVNPLPAPISGPSTVCEQSVVMMTDATAGGVWSSDNSFVASVAPMGGGIGAVTGVSAGTTTISYMLTATGCYQTKNITVNPTPAAITGSGHVCLGSSRTLSSTTSGGVWSSSNSSVAPVNAAGVVSGVALGTAYISYAFPGSGCAAIRMVTVQPLPGEFAVTGGGHYCTGTGGIAVGLNGSQIGVSYALYYGTSATGYLTGTGLPLNFGAMTLGGTYTVLATNPTTGCTKPMSGNAVVVVDPNVTPVVAINAAPGDTICPALPVTLTPAPVNGGTAPTYIWKVNGTVVSTANSYTYMPANGDLVGVTMTSNGYCVAPATADAEKVMHVLPTAAPAVAVNVTPGDTVCQYSLVTYVANPSYGGTTPVYAWSVNGVISGAGAVFSYVPVDGDVVKCRMISNYACRLNDTAHSGAVNMVVDSLLIPHVTVAAHPGMSVHTGDTVLFVANYSNAGTHPSFRWLINGVPVAGATNDSFRTSSLHHYDSVSVQVTSSDVCKDVTAHDWLFMTVSPLGVNSVAVATDVRLLPNPNNGSFSIRGAWGTGNEEVNVEVTNMIGQVVYRGLVNARNGKINDNIQLDHSLANGMYMLNMHTESTSKVFHFVVEQ